MKVASYCRPFLVEIMNIVQYHWPHIESGSSIILTEIQNDLMRQDYNKVKQLIKADKNWQYNAFERRFKRRNS